jgi:hypothetical protein
MSRGILELHTTIAGTLVSWVGPDGYGEGTDQMRRDTAAKVASLVVEAIEGICLVPGCCPHTGTWEARTAEVLDRAAAIGPPDHYSDYAADSWKAGRDAALTEARWALDVAAAAVREDGQ